ncbi:bifunctional diguanylate cyclase/phosphodiesterase [Campylobacter gastrosuis]|uniref:EAL domain-containing protein n=1 Tax=Campylobacter gastrosuis TaxID=2974576 RepID=A0ABT7HR36_9BACT|nr:LapD/MoxY N-terminal periplasmic domain-containing protein [Campylobacter gastrosuis]MDL0089366.1 EAL domain-containing protein [Campylobacter gastrosuis]
MTLFQRIMGAIIAFGILIFIAVGYLNFNSLNSYINDQLGINARHTANSLGLSLKSVVDTEDLSMAQTMINSMFDSGYYQMIRLDDVDGKVLIESREKLVVDDVPEWFFKVAKLNAPIENSEIMTGWTKFGTLYVQSSTGRAYYELYTGMIGILGTLVSIFLVMILCVYLVVKLILSEPLDKMQKQAEAILEHKFITQDKIPSATDLKQMALAMNAMVKKVEDIFEQEKKTLNKNQELLYKDSDSGLYNRRYFQTKFEEYVASEEYSSGAIVLVSFTDLISLKKTLGFERLQSLITKISQTLQDSVNQSKVTSFVARLNDNDFVLLHTGVLSENLRGEIEKINENLREIFSSFDITDQCGLNIAVVDYDHQSDLKTTLTRADVTLVSARSAGNFEYKIFTEGSQAIVLGKEQYRDLITKSMQNDMFKFAAQRVVSDDSDLEHRELYLRLVDDGGKWQMASYFMPMVNELSLSASLDIYVLERVLNMLLNGSLINDTLAINLSKDVINEDENFTRLTAILKKISTASKHKIYIEIPDRDDISVANTAKLIDTLKKHGFGFGFDHFEFNQNSIEKLKEISPNYVKIRAANITDFFKDKDVDESRKSLDVIMNSKGIKIIGIGVENEEQKRRLIELGITSMQGIYIDDTKNIG